jgi:hypothetical protein
VVRCKDATAAADELPGLLRYRSAPSTLLGEVMCGDQDFPAAAGGGGHGPRRHRQHPCALSHRAPLRVPGLQASLPRRGRSLHGRSCRLATTAAAAHVPVATAADSHHGGLYHNVSSGGTEYGAAVGAGNSLICQSSSPAGFLTNGNWWPMPCLVVLLPFRGPLTFHRWRSACVVGKRPPRSDQLSSLDRGRRDAEGEDVGGGHGAVDPLME